MNPPGFTNTPPETPPPYLEGLLNQAGLQNQCDRNSGISEQHFPPPPDAISGCQRSCRIHAGPNRRNCTHPRPPVKSWELLRHGIIQNATEKLSVQ